jgi:hypothetical protein
MNDAEDFITAIAALHGASDEDDLCAPFLSVLPVTGIGISTFRAPFGPEIVCASGPNAAQLEEIQLDLGEGPSWEATRSGRPVFEADVQTAASTAWPIASMAMREADLGAVFAFPMTVGALSVGAVALYRQRCGAISPDIAQDTAALTDAAARQVLRRALTRVGDASDENAEQPNGYSRREIYQASGVLAAQTGVGAGDALLLLRAYAFADGCSVRALAHDVLTHTVDLTNRNDSAR